MRSIRRDLQLWLLGALAVGGIVMVAVSYVVTRTEMGEQFDANLQQVALAIAEHHAFGLDYRAPTREQLPSLPRIFEEDDDFDFVTLARSTDGTVVYSSDPGLSFPAQRETGLADIEANGETWRIYTLVTERGSVEVAQRDSVRSLLAAATAARIAIPPICLVALVALLIDWGVNRGLRPLERLAAEIETRRPESLVPVGTEPMPLELRTLAAAMNRLIGRLSTTLEAQRRFTADAAHGLRTPITALRLQLQLVADSERANQREASIARLRAGIDRTQHLVEQLLQLSRLGPDSATAHAPVDLATIVREAVVDFELIAHQRGVDLGADAPRPVEVSGDAHELAILAANLVDNALRYSPPGAVVDVRARREDGIAVLEIADTGPGIADAERGRAFDRFFRGSGADGEAGTGLGLAIVRSIAERHRARVALRPGAHGTGLVATVRFEGLPGMSS